MQSSFEGLQQMLKRITEIERKLRASGTLKRMLGRLLVDQTKRRIESEKSSPDGDPWKLWEPSYAETRGAGHSLLIDTRALLNSLKASVTKDGASVSSDREYALAVQDKRPFLGLSASNEDEIQDLITTWARREL